ncbi:helix-turn-helix domain-containing protein [Embleya sp. NBC_00896]|uniref:helix-turn-helix domain-containing protein n=1 Tax=Embleya sp. NBC_00896 TaxID=2975961 RepID=UPI00386E6B80|nr:helix-turn-helix transcriptional regulator [Embleya sp. NBC_00896]WSY13174.1 helix-turn-helix transcriptional regulator [Embleya sp. NBC_00896]WSY13183.1 helix-turn-helix transcriptional regulator [Embleya sp. NBC_00896]WSY13192.1 helix-turn-helix transcriptional regulator [Embleya sp. NBC_00896]
MNAREAMRRRAAKAAAEPVPETSHADAMTTGEVEEFDQAYAEAALGDAMAQAVYDRRIALGWTKAELARRAGMNERVIRRLEDGGRPVTTPTLLRLGRALGGHFIVALLSDNPVVTFKPAARRATRSTTRSACRAPATSTTRGGQSLLAGLPRKSRSATTAGNTVHRLRVDV